MARKVKALAASFNGACKTPASTTASLIRKLSYGVYRLYSREPDPKTGKRKSLGIFATRAAARQHEKAVQFFKHG